MEDGRRFFVIRHGHRCDYFFRKKGVNWIERAFPGGGKFVRFDHALPIHLPVRHGGPAGYNDDTPITQPGYEMAVLMGRRLKKHCPTISSVYCSPSLRCVQTAQGIMEGYEGDLTMNIEPGLFQWTRWCKHGVLPQWLCPAELCAAGFPVNVNHVPIDYDLDLHETLKNYYDRSYDFIKKLLEKDKSRAILLVAHAGSLDVLTRQLCGGEPLDRRGFAEFLSETSYLSCAEAVQTDKMRWKMSTSTVLPPTKTGLRD
ncbi:hypothetical protein AB6A40_003590 [Gnathostoma spinigerum]|uniref:Phosphoglycerate mutase n=1 Tax=Gnathostoma spinigerum TaxID=75299 RepID=A0ABD6EB60_9BILA